MQGRSTKGPTHPFAELTFIRLQAPPNRVHRHRGPQSHAVVRGGGRGRRGHKLTVHVKGRPMMNNRRVLPADHRRSNAGRPFVKKRRTVAAPRDNPGTPPYTACTCVSGGGHECRRSPTNGRDHTPDARRPSNRPPIPSPNRRRFPHDPHRSAPSRRDGPLSPMPWCPAPACWRTARRLSRAPQRAIRSGQEQSQFPVSLQK